MRHKSNSKFKKTRRCAMFKSEKQNKISAIAEQVKKIARDRDIEAIQLSLQQQVIEKLNSHTFNLMIVGEFANGKTTLIKSLMGLDDIDLPTASGANTSRIVEIHYSTHVELFKIGDSQIRKQIAISDLSNAITDNGAESFHLELHCPSELGRHGVTIIDTPGLQDINKQRLAITFNYLPKADALLFVMDGKEGFKSSEYEFLEETLKQASFSRIIVAVNKLDQIDDEIAIQRMISQIKDKLGRIFDADVPVYGISALDALEGLINRDENMLARSGVPKLEQYLISFMQNERYEAMLKSAVAQLQANISALGNTLSMTDRTLNWTPDEHNQRCADIQAKIEDTAQKLSHEREQFSNEIKREKMHFLDDCRSWLNTQCLTKLIAALRQADVKYLTEEYINDATRHLIARGIQQRWDSFSEKTQEVSTQANGRCNRLLDQVRSELAEIPSDSTLVKIPFNLSSVEWAAILLGLTYLMTGLITVLLAAWVGSTFNIMDEIKNFQKKNIIDAVEENFKSIIPGIVDRLEQEVERVCHEIESDTWDRISKTIDSELKALNDALDKSISERQSGEANITSLRKQLASEMDILNESSQQLKNLM